MQTNPTNLCSRSVVTVFGGVAMSLSEIVTKIVIGINRNQNRCCKVLCSNDLRE